LLMGSEGDRDRYSRICNITGLDFFNDIHEMWIFSNVKGKDNSWDPITVVYGKFKNYSNKVNSLKFIIHKYADYTIYEFNIGKNTEIRNFYVLPFNDEIMIIGDNLISLQIALDTYNRTIPNIETNIYLKSKYDSLRDLNNISYIIADITEKSDAFGLLLMLEDVSFFYMGVSKINDRYRFEFRIFMKAPEKNKEFISFIKTIISAQSSKYDEKDKDLDEFFQSLRFSVENEYLLITIELTPELLKRIFSSK
ncbi:MAG: hypothetical protein JW737_08700, partial [Acidobacteria bacterium]|nr:hypothetical protein [Acidobacteriota bacterium]